MNLQYKIDNMIYGEGISGSKKEAEQEAAKVALSKLAIKKDNTNE